MKRDLVGARVVLAGATGGLGREIGRELVAAGASLVLFARDRGRLEALDLPGPRVAGDLADAGACREAVEQARASFGGLDGVVNAAGVVAFGELGALSDPVLDELLCANLIGPVRLIRAALPVLSGGFIAQLSAVVAERPMPGMAFYSATKAAMTALDQALAKELRRRGIDVIDLRPPHTETGLATRPIDGVAPRLPVGLAPERVAARVVAAIVDRERVVTSTAF
jgi:NAD(P)-dependent dehydrogenase (short-subunit alcohol dehydrogenase family)